MNKYITLIERGQSASGNNIFNKRIIIIFGVFFFFFFNFLLNLLSVCLKKNEIKKLQISSNGNFCF